jgi:hypothetical protein
MASPHYPPLFLSTPFPLSTQPPRSLIPPSLFSLLQFTPHQSLVFPIPTPPPRWNLTIPTTTLTILPCCVLSPFLPSSPISALRMSSFGRLSSPLFHTSCALPNFHPCHSPFLMDPSSPLNPADTFPSFAFLFLSPFGLSLILPYLTLSSTSPPSCKPLVLVSLLPPHFPSLPRET